MAAWIPIALNIAGSLLGGGGKSGGAGGGGGILGSLFKGAMGLFGGGGGGAGGGGLLGGLLGNLFKSRSQVIPQISAGLQNGQPFVGIGNGLGSARLNVGGDFMRDVFQAGSDGQITVRELLDLVGDHGSVSANG